MTFKELCFYTTLALCTGFCVHAVLAPDAELWRDKRGEVIGYRCAATDWYLVPMSDSRCQDAIQSGSWKSVEIDAELFPR